MYTVFNSSSAKNYGILNKHLYMKYYLIINKIQTQKQYNKANIIWIQMFDKANNINRRFNQLSKMVIWFIVFKALNKNGSTWSMKLRYWYRYIMNNKDKIHFFWSSINFVWIKIILKFINILVFKKKVKIIKFWY